MAEEKVFRKLSELKGWDKNPRKVTPEGIERLKYQIKELNGGQPYKPLLINQDNIVLGGNQRLKAYEELGIDPVWVNIVHTANESEMYKYALSDNDHIGQTDVERLLKEMPHLEIDWTKFAVDTNNSALLTTLQKYSAPDLQEEWVGMPEFDQQDLEGEKQLIVTFKNMEDYWAFAKLIGQKLTEKTQSIWFPEVKWDRTTGKSWEEDKDRDKDKDKDEE